jgi:hypothetical protein
LRKWKIREPVNIAKVVKRLGTPEKKRYVSLLKDFRDSDDPTKFAVEEQFIQGIKIFFARLNDSYRVKYTVYPDEEVIAILAVGDHKQVGLRE